MKKLLFISVLVSVAVFGYSQGKVEVIGGEPLDKLVNNKVASVDTNNLWGYRIQLYFSTSRTEATKMASKFKAQYPEMAVEVYQDYYQPNWRVRVGNYYRKIDAQKDMHRFAAEFGDVFLVRDVIQLPSLR
ncbi:MAG: SPOR domain-containing protein [Flavobacteriales bacterium]|nr:SPOR domain-containing protein [Flavobacteriales bacterium]